MPEPQPEISGAAERVVLQAWERRIPADIGARHDAIDTTRSILVQAPAGAGKTNLLTQRYLALLAQVDEPEQVLAVTFTRAATAEMRSRIVGGLEYARRNPSPAPDESSEIPLARAALRHAEALGWRILEQPHRLDIQTIDSLCMRLAHGQPLLARLGGALQPSDDAAALYAEAARRTTASLGSGDEELNGALRTVLLLRDNNLHEVERLLAGMLNDRDAWLGVLPLAPVEAIDWDEVRATLEAPFSAERRSLFSALHSTLQAMPEHHEELLQLARYASANLHELSGPTSRLRALLDLSSMPGSTEEAAPVWLALSCLLLTGGASWRKGWNKNDGIPGKGTGAGSREREQWVRRMKAFPVNLQTHPDSGLLLPLLCRIQSLPHAGYSDDQWRTLLAVFRLLRRAAAELRLVFAEAGKVDFIEIAQAAETVLQDEGSLRGMLESERKQHILIDEFQDTSRAQYRLIAALLREWSDGDGRTVFLVGDPLQSIYGFRRAEVALFHQTRRHGLPCGSPDEQRLRHCRPLTLTHNFRSHQALVFALNDRFAPMFQNSAAEDADGFVAAQAWPRAVVEPSLRLHLQIAANGEGQDRDGSSDASTVTHTLPVEAEAASVVDILADELRIAAEAQDNGAEEYRIAILVRSRAHLAAILPALRAANIPYRAVDLEPLADQPEILDILSLLRALIHPADRLSWLGVFRAPWCGLLLHDLHTLSGSDDPELLRRPIAELLDTRIPFLSADGQDRAARTWRALRAARSSRYAGGSISLSAWLERAWLTVGGDACVDATGSDNIDAFLRLLDTAAPSGADILRGDFVRRLGKLCAAPDARAGERYGVQVMTMHKAKGLGFDVVLLPGLDRTTRGRQSELLAMLQRAHSGDTLTDEILLAPIGSRDGEPDKTYAWVTKQKAQREREETARLFYVAATRARTRLHLFATLGENEKEGKLNNPKSGSLLAAAWPGLEADALAQYQTRRSKVEKIAASAEEPTAIRRTTQPSYTLEQLPLTWTRDNIRAGIAWSKTSGESTDNAPAPLFTRSESGSLLARARGAAMHALMEQLVVLLRRDTLEPELWKTRLTRVAEHALSTGAVPRAAVSAMADSLADTALSVARDPIGQWIVGPHPEGRAESAWQQWDGSGNLRTVRIDRCFRAGETPGAAGDQSLWIIDYKTGTGPEAFADEAALETWLAGQKKLHQDQLSTYAAFLAASAEAGTHPANTRCGLYFPELRQLIHWQADNAEDNTQPL